MKKKNFESDDSELMYEITVESEVTQVTREEFYGNLLKRLEESRQAGIVYYSQVMLEDLLLFVCERELFGKPIILLDSEEEEAKGSGHKYRTVVFDDREFANCESLVVSCEGDRDKSENTSLLGNVLECANQ
ncbi:MAG: hypothetical protein K9N06_11755 [Candidatus Cloacimonetes bacterium]|nr:hypothetical protein [Candidatus Cloacimonadota bacterium]